MDAARGAAPTPAADRRVGDLPEPARLEDGEPDGHDDLPPARIADPDRPAAMLEDSAARAREQHEAERAEEREVDRPLDLRERGRLRGTDPLLEQARRASRLARERRGGAPGIDEAEQRQHGQQDRGPEQQRPHARIPGPQAQPEMYADAPVRPRDEQDDALAQAEIGPEVPEAERHASVGIG